MREGGGARGGARDCRRVGARLGESNARRTIPDDAIFKPCVLTSASYAAGLYSTGLPRGLVSGTLCFADVFEKIRFPFQNNS